MTEINDLKANNRFAIVDSTRQAGVGLLTYPSQPTGTLLKTRSHPPLNNQPFLCNPISQAQTILPELRFWFFVFLKVEREKKWAGRPTHLERTEDC
jgi:hypothetical protein